MKKIVMIIFALAVAFGFGYKRANDGKPRNIETKSYAVGENFSFNSLSGKVDSYEFVKNKEADINYLVVKFIITNNSNTNRNASEILINCTFHRGLDNAIAQNMVEKGIPKEAFSGIDHVYDKDDLLIKSKESKEYYIYYPLSKYPRKYESCIKFTNGLYMDKYKDKLKDLTFYYEIVNLGEL